jgi:riboflavin synthase
MFTGIVVEMGTVRRAKTRGGLVELEIEAPKIARELRAGDSVAVNGVCLTARSATRKRFSSQVVPETLARSNLGRLKRGSDVNLELPARLSDRLGGHLVQGHVDGVARVLRVETEDEASRVWLGANEDIMRFLVTKGSVTIDGVSLTIAEVGRTSFQVALIPHTLSATTLREVEVDDQVNVEVDVLAKYVDKLLERKV